MYATILNQLRRAGGLARARRQAAPLRLPTLRRRQRCRHAQNAMLAPMGLRPRCRSANQRLISSQKGSFLFEVTPLSLAELLPHLAWLAQVPSAPIRLAKINRREAIAANRLINQSRVLADGRGCRCRRNVQFYHLCWPRD